jgi:site-specific DNA-methyltransferase (adenine-specific)
VIDLQHGDSRDVIKTLADASIDSVVCDPPYALVSIVKRFGGENAAPAKDGDVYARSSRGFMGKQWDTGEVAFDPAFWRDVMRVMKPGAHLLAFGGTRTYHRLAVAIEDAGFEIRDQIGWLYGSGFPKSHNIGNGWGTALKPAWEPIVMARKPLIGTVAANVLAHGTGAINVDGCRVQWSGPEDAAAAVGFADSRARGTAKQSQSIGKESRDGTNTYDPAALKGRWPANVIHDGSEEVLAAFPESDDGVAGKRTGVAHVTLHGLGARDEEWGGYGGGGSAARFFYSAKADAGDRLGSKHPTVKPVDLMAYLCRLVTPPGGTVLDPFAGSGTTGMACMREGFNAVLIEREAEYVADIKRRIAHVSGQDAPLFGGSAA